MQLSVLLPVREVNTFTKSSIFSTLNALINIDAELILITSNASDYSILQKWTVEYEQVVIITSTVDNIIFKLNIGLQASRGTFIARMDADDICEEDRFETQLKFISENSFDFVFGEAIVINEKGIKTGEVMVSKLGKINFRCGLIHPTMLARKTAITELGGYANIQHSEDYHLWLRAVASKARIGTQMKRLIRYRRHEKQMTNFGNRYMIFKSNIAIKILIFFQFQKYNLLLGIFEDAIMLLVTYFKSLRR